MTHYLATYDISSDKKRIKLAKILNDYGRRVQESVFEIPEIKKHAWRECMDRINKNIKLTGDESIRIYSFCDECRRKIKILGKGKKAMDVKDVYIF